MDFVRKIRMELARQKKAAGLSDMTSAVVSLGLIAIIGAVVLIVLAGLQSSSQVIAGSASYNAITYGITGVSTIMQYLPLVALVIVAAVIITIVVLAFAFGGGRKGAEL
jgi:hypothetical protein